jgi:hypothetical protein
MKSIKRRPMLLLPLMALGLSLITTFFAPMAAVRADDTSPSVRQGMQPAAYNEATSARKTIYLFSGDFPQNLFTQYPTPPIKETRFWQFMDKEMSGTGDLRLTEDPTRADYRVELRCSGLRNCSKLMVDIKDPNRNLLSSFSLKRFSSLGGLGDPKLDVVARELTQKLDERLKLLPQGGYGNTD